MRVLHTSDLHLGASWEDVSRLPEQESLLDWLLELITTREVELLLIAGDLFDSAQPSAEAQRLYYRFLSRLADTPLRSAVICGGNHDSPSRLDAPSELLVARGIHVVGGYGSTNEARLLIPIDHGAQPVVVAAVPYVHEARLGVSVIGGEGANPAAELQRAIGNLYGRLAREARTRWPTGKLLAMGHLSCEGSSRDDCPYEVHHVGSLGTLPATVFGEEWAYVALGHVHRGYRVGRSRAWYSGAPLPTAADEARREQSVLLFDTDSTDAPGFAPERVPVPRFRQLQGHRGTEEELRAALVAMRWDEALPPLVQLEQWVDAYDPSLGRRWEEWWRDQFRGAAPPRLVALRQQRRGASAEACDALLEAAPRLEELRPEEVFARLCQQAACEQTEGIKLAFASLLEALARGEDAKEGEAP